MVLVLLAASACARGESSSEPLDGSAAAIEGEAPSHAPKKRAKKRAGPNLGPVKVTFLVVDEQGRPRSDVPVRYSGDASGTVLSDARGRAILSVAPGTYRAGVPVGCQDRVEIAKAPADGTLRVAPGKAPKPIRLEIEMRRRFFPSGPVTWSPEPPWASGARVRLQFAIFDRCDDSRAKKTSFDDLEYRPTNLDLLDSTPQRTDADGLASVTFACRRAGDASLFLEDPENRKDRIDLLKIRPPPFGPIDWCG